MCGKVTHDRYYISCTHTLHRHTYTHAAQAGGEEKARMLCVTHIHSMYTYTHISIQATKLPLQRMTDTNIRGFLSISIVLFNSIVHF